MIKQCLGGYANHITQDTTSNTTDTAEPFTAAQYAQINQLGHDLSNPSAALADLAAMSQVMQEILSQVEQDEQGRTERIRGAKIKAAQIRPPL